MNPEQRRDWKLLWDLFWSFSKIGPSTFGGGYAMLPAIEREVVHHRRWVTEGEMGEVISISGAAPGGIGVNAAAFIGYKLMGWRGIIAAVVGIMLPTFLLVLLLGIIFLHVRHNPKVAAAMHGVQTAVLALIVHSGTKMARIAIMDKTTTGTFFIAFAAVLFLAIPPIHIILLGAVAGFVLVKFKEKTGMPVCFEKKVEAWKSSPSTGSKSAYSQFPDCYFGDGI